MTQPAHRLPALVALVLAATCVGVTPLTAQIQNPITAAREAYRRAQEEAKRKQEEESRRRQGQNQPSQTSAPAAPGVSQSGQPSATPIGPQETARLAAAAGFLDVAGLKLGAPLASVEPLLKSLNPKFVFRPQVEIVWPSDRAGIETQPPPTAPKSVKSLQAEVLDGSYTEAWGIEFAEHPNPAVVITISRTVSYGQGRGGPAIDGLLDALRKKYGPESATNASAMIPNNSQRAFVGRWYFDERGQGLRGNLGSQLYGSCSGVGTQIQAGNPGLCGTLTILDANVQASGNGIVNTFMVKVTNHPLEYTAQETNKAYLLQYEEDRARQQQKAATQRPGPKL